MDNTFSLAWITPFLNSLRAALSVSVFGWFFMSQTWSCYFVFRRKPQTILSLVWKTSRLLALNELSQVYCKCFKTNTGGITSTTSTLYQSVLLFFCIPILFLYSCALLIKAVPYDYSMRWSCRNVAGTKISRLHLSVTVETHTPHFVSETGSNDTLIMLESMIKLFILQDTYKAMMLLLFRDEKFMA